MWIRACEFTQDGEGSSTSNFILYYIQVYHNIKHVINYGQTTFWQHWKFNDLQTSNCETLKGAFGAQIQIRNQMMSSNACVWGAGFGSLGFWCLCLDVGFEFMGLASLFF